MASPITSTTSVNFSRIALQSGGKKATQLAYFDHEVEIQQAMEIIFRNKTFHLPLPKLIVALEGGLNNTNEKPIDFNEKQLSTSVAKLLLDIGRNKLSDVENAPWLFASVQHDSVAGRIIQTTKQQYLANDIPLARFVNIGIDVCPSMPLEKAPCDYQSTVNAILSKDADSNKVETTITQGSTTSHRILNKRLSRVILYGKQKQDLVDRCTILQKCVEEISRQQDDDQSENLNIPKVILLYGGDVTHVEPIHRLISDECDQKNFGLVIIRGSGGLADILAWVCDKIRNGGVCTHESDRMSITTVFLRELSVLVHQLLSKDTHEDLITLVTHLSLTRCRKVRVCDEEDDLSLYFLEAILSANQNQRLSSLKLHLSLAFDLNQPKFASRILRVNQDLAEKDLIQLAKMAIIRDQVEFLQILEDVSGVTSDGLGEKIDCELSSTMNYNHALFLECIEQEFGCHLEEIYRPSDEQCEHAEDEIQLINVKLFLWSVFFDHYKLSLHFWRRLNDRLCGALVAAHIYRHTADLCVKRSSTEMLTVQTLRDHADEYENLAIRLIQSLYTSTPTMARLAIKRENVEFNKFSALEIAIMSRSEDFVGHTTVQEVFDAVWSGDPKRIIKGKHFDRILVNTVSSFGNATVGIKANDQKNVLKHFLALRDRISRPRVKYRVHFLFYLAFLCLLSFLILFVKTPLTKICANPNGECSLDELLSSSSANPSEQSWSILQVIINIWIFMFALEEFRKVKSFKTKNIGLRQAFMVYIDQPWNKLDALCVVTYLVSILLEFYGTELSLNAARALLAMDIVLWFIRLLILSMINRTVGPMFLLIQAMLNDTRTFFAIFFVFTSAYGVASYSLLKSGQLSFDLSVFRKVFHQAYWHLFGEINDLDDVKGTGLILNLVCSMIGLFEDNFYLTGWVAFILLAFYMAISNILLVNLLVAMFSNTFNRMHAKMDTLWKFHRYHIIKEYTILSTLPPPMNLFSTIDYDVKPFNPELTGDQILNLRKREALAYDSDMFEQATKAKQSNIDHQEKVDLHMRQLRKMITQVKVTCEASIEDVQP